MKIVGMLPGSQSKVSEISGGVISPHTRIERVIPLGYLGYLGTNNNTKTPFAPATDTKKEEKTIKKAVVAEMPPWVSVADPADVPRRVLMALQFAINSPKSKGGVFLDRLIDRAKMWDLTVAHDKRADWMAGVDALKEKGVLCEINGMWQAL